MKKLLQTILIILLLALAGFIIINFSYFYKLACFSFKRVQIQLDNQMPAGERGAVRLPPDFLEIPRLEIRAPLLYPAANDERTIQAALQSGVAHYFGAAAPGEAGNAYFVGHSSDYPWAAGEYKTVFATLPKIKIGDIIYVSSQTKTFSYKVIEIKIISAGDLSAFSQNDDGKKLLTLQTSYPLGTAAKRFLVIAEMQE